MPHDESLPAISRRPLAGGGAPPTSPLRTVTSRTHAHHVGGVPPMFEAGRHASAAERVLDPRAAQGECEP